MASHKPKDELDSPTRDSPISFSQVLDLPQPDPLLEQSCCGPRKKWSRLRIMEKVVLFGWYFALTVSLCLTIYKISVIDWRSGPDSTYAAIMAVAAVFSFVYLTNGVFQEQPHDMMALCITNLIVLGYVVINYVNSLHRHNEQINTMKLVRLIFTALFTIVFLPLSAYLAYDYWSRKNLITFAVGSVNPRKQRMVQILFMFLSALAFDLQLQINFFLLVLQQGIERIKMQEAIILVAGIVITIAWMILGRVSVRKENGYYVLSFILLTLPNFAYAGYAFYTLKMVSTTNEMFMLTVLSGISAVVMHLLVVVLMYLVYGNFGKGLKGHLYEWDLSEEEVEEERRRQSTNMSTTAAGDESYPSL